MPAPKEVHCPECRRPVPWTEESVYRPFCSKRCQLVDFGGWAMERHRIPEAESDLMSEQLEDAADKADD